MPIIRLFEFEVRVSICYDIPIHNCNRVLEAFE